MTLLPQGPAADMLKNPFAGTAGGGLKYPSNLGSSRYGHWIQFTAMVPTASKYKGQLSSSLPNSMPNLSGMEKGLNALGSSVSSSSIGSKIINGLGNISGVFSGITSGYDQQAAINAAASTPGAINSALGNLGSTAKQIYQIITSPGSVSPTDSISLYTPDSMSLSQLVTYTSISKTDALGNVGMGAEAAAQGGSVYDKIQQGDGTAKESLMGSTFNNPMVAEGIGYGGQKMGALGKGASQMTLAKGGYAKNPQLEVIFQQVEFREYQFNFTFTPRNAQEAQTVKEIITQFRFHQLPELDQGGAGRYFIVPSFFQLEHIFQGGENPHLHKFAPCVLKSVYVDYAPNGWVTYEDAFPVQTMLVLLFQEIEIMTKERIRDGY